MLRELYQFLISGKNWYKKFSLTSWFTLVIRKHDVPDDLASQEHTRKCYEKTKARLHFDVKACVCASMPTRGSDQYLFHLVWSNIYLIEFRRKKRKTHFVIIVFKIVMLILIPRLLKSGLIQHRSLQVTNFHITYDKGKTTFSLLDRCYLPGLRRKASVIKI